MNTVLGCLGHKMNGIRLSPLARNSYQTYQIIEFKAGLSIMSHLLSQQNFGLSLY